MPDKPSETNKRKARISLPENRAKVLPRRPYPKKFRETKEHYKLRKSDSDGNLS